MNIASIKDIILSIAQSLQLSTIVPALFFILLNSIFIFPVKNYLSTEDSIVILIFTIISLSYLLYAFNGTFIRFLEGYIGWDLFFLKGIKNERIKSYQIKYNKLKQNKERSNNTSKINAIQELYLNFPILEDNIKPTGLGNKIKAFEDYSFDRYGIDAVALWPRIVPILIENKYMEVVSQKKLVFDFLMNLLFVTLILGIEVTFKLCFLNNLDLVIISSLITTIFSIILYKGMLNCAVQWGNTIRVAFDLFRHDLWNKFKLDKVSNYQEEILTWETLSILINEGRDWNGWISFNKFKY
jgi:hypothetical protein